MHSCKIAQMSCIGDTLDGFHHTKRLKELKVNYTSERIIGEHYLDMPTLAVSPRSADIREGAKLEGRG